MQFSPTRGCFSQMFKKQISKHSSKQFFWHQFFLWKTPSSRFFLFFPLFACLYILKLFHLPVFEELRKLHAKDFMFSVKIGREIIFQSWQLYDCFYTQMSQLCHSALSCSWQLKTIDQSIVLKNWAQMHQNNQFHHNQQNQCIHQIHHNHPNQFIHQIHQNPQFHQNQNQQIQQNHQNCQIHQNHWIQQIP